MRNLLIGLIVLMTSLCLYGQDVEVRLNSDIGFNANNLQTNIDWLNVENRSKTLGLNLEGLYHFRAGKNLRPFVGTGIGYEDRSFQYDVKSERFGFTVNSVNINQEFISIPLIAGLEYKVFCNNSIGMQFQVGYNIATNKNQTIESPEGTTAIFGSLEYSYIFRLRSKNHLSKSISLYSKMQLSTNLFLKLTATYANNNTYGSFDHGSLQKQTITNIGTNEQTQHYSSFTSLDQDTFGDFLQIGVGLSKWF